MAENRSRSEPFIEGADRFPPDARRDRRPSPSGPDSRRRKTQQRRRRNSVFQYIAVMFIATFVLLLFTFLMERRQSQQQIDDLRQSASAVQTLQGLMEENTALKGQLAELEEQVKDLNGQLAQRENDVTSLETQSANLTGQLENTQAAMDYFWQINEAYVRGRNNLCRSLIASMEEAKLQDSLPKENVTGTDRFSPYDRYMEIRGKVVK